MPKTETLNWEEKRGRIAADFSEVKEAMAAVGLSPVKLRRALRVEVGAEAGSYGASLAPESGAAEGFLTGICPDVG